MATPTGRRRRPATDEAPPSAEERVVHAPSAAPPTGRRRRPETAVDAPAAVPPTGRRRRPEPSGSSVDAPAAVPPTGRRRRTESPTAVPAGPPSGRRRRVEPIPPARDAAGAGTGHRGRPAASTAAELTKPASGGHRRKPAPSGTVAVPPSPQVGQSPEPASKPAPVIPITAARGHRRRRGTPKAPPSGTQALVAGAAAVAVAAVGALATNSGAVSLGGHNTDLARASTVGLTRSDAGPDLAAADARASRDRARAALNKRIADAAAAKAKQDALERALKLAREKAARLALLARSFFLPVHGYHLTAGFGDGGGLWSHGHTGQDFACQTGTPIRAIGSGIIIWSGWDGAYGWKTIERLNDGTEIWYAHQSRILVRSGPVTAGQVIGRVGSTGNTTGPHLHLEVRPGGGDPVNPMPWLRAHGMHP